MPESACFLKVLLHLPATHLTSLFYLFDSSFSLKKEISLVRILHLSTWILSQVFLNLRQFFLIYVTVPLFPGGLRKKTNSRCAKMAANLNVSHFKKSLCVQIAKHMIFFGEALVAM